MLSNCITSCNIIYFKYMYYIIENDCLATYEIAIKWLMRYRKSLTEASELESSGW